MPYRKKAAIYKRRLEFLLKTKPRNDADHCHGKKEEKKMLLFAEGEAQGRAQRKHFLGVTKILISFHLVFSFSCH